MRVRLVKAGKLTPTSGEGAHAWPDAPPPPTKPKSNNTLRSSHGGRLQIKRPAHGAASRRAVHTPLILVPAAADLTSLVSCPLDA